MCYRKKLSVVFNTMEINIILLKLLNLFFCNRILNNTLGCLFFCFYAAFSFNQQIKKYQDLYLKLAIVYWLKRNQDIDHPVLLYSEINGTLMYFCVKENFNV